MDLQDAREQLEQMRTELDAVLAGGAPADSDGGERDQGADAAAELAETELAQAEREAALEHRQLVLAALARLDAGTYGTCVDCGGQISEARLQVRPEAARCIECQARAEAA